MTGHERAGAPEPWEAEHPVDAALCRRLVAAQFPARAEGEPEHLGSGWCNDVWRLGEYTWRFPRKAVAVAPLTRDLRLLPALAPLLVVPVPVPEYVGAPGPDFPAPFYGHRHLPGSSADRAVLDESSRVRLAPVLGEWLRGLHGIPAAAARELGVPDGAERCDLARRVRLARGQLEGAAAGLDEAGAAGLREALAPEAWPAPEGEALLHGDLYARHLLVDAPGDLTGVIDWEDCCWGDPAADLSLAATFLPPGARGPFWQAYGEVSPATWARAVAFGWTYVAFLGAYAGAAQDEVLAREVRRMAEHLRA